MFAAADQITGWSGWWGSLLSLCAPGSFSRGLQGGYSGLGWWQERWGGELWLKGAFPLKCLPACTPANTITSLVGSASWTNEGLRVEGRGFDVLGSWLLVFSLPLSFSACPTSKNERGVEKQMFSGMYLYRVHFIHPLLHTPICPLLLHLRRTYSKDLSPYLYIQLNILNRLTLYI